MLSKNQTIGVVCGIVLPTILVVIILIAFFQWRRTARKHVEDYYTPPKELVIPPNFSYQASDEGIRKRAWLLTESARLTFSGAKLKKGSIDTASIVATIDAFGPIYQQEPSKKLVKLMKSEENRDLAFSHFIVTTLVSSILPDQKQRVSLLDPMVLSLYHHCRCPETFIRPGYERDQGILRAALGSALPRADTRQAQMELKAYILSVAEQLIEVEERVATDLEEDIKNFADLGNVLMTQQAKWQWEFKLDEDPGYDYILETPGLRRVIEKDGFPKTTRNVFHELCAVGYPAKPYSAALLRDWKKNRLLFGIGVSYVMPEPREEEVQYPEGEEWRYYL